MKQKLENKQENSNLSNLSQTENSSNHIVLPYRDEKVMIYGITFEDRTFHDGSYLQYTGTKRIGVFTIKIVSDRLDAPVKRVGFMGTGSFMDNSDEYPYQVEGTPKADDKNCLWDIEFELYKFIMGQETYSYFKGSFFVETTNNTYYWLKDKNSMDFEFNSSSRLKLCNFDC